MDQSGPGSNGNEEVLPLLSVHLLMVILGQDVNELSTFKLTFLCSYLLRVFFFLSNKNNL